MANLKTLATQGIEPNGGGALSSKNVSKLVGKEVSKKLRNFTLSRISKFTAFTKKFYPLPEVEGKVAFTLAEVLITLGIIGIVAALTLSSVIQNYREQQTVAKLKKTYSLLTQAMASAVDEYGTLDTWGLGGGDSPAGAKILQDQLLTPYLKIADYCEKQGSCVGGKPYKYLYGTPHISYVWQDRYRHVVLSDGTLLIFHVSGEQCNSSSLKPWFACADIMVDVDGFYKGPNTFGKDTFNFSVKKNRIVPSGTYAETSDFKWSCNRHNAYGSACTAWVIYNENMDYLHCDDLSWTGKRRCKDK